MSDYTEQFKDPRWQQFRLKVLARDGFKCVWCEGGKSTLHAHHMYYISKRKPWEYPEGCVLTLCEECHKIAHKIPEEHSDWETLVHFTSRSIKGYALGLDLGRAAYFFGANNVEEMADIVSLSLQKNKQLWVKKIKAHQKTKINKKVNQVKFGGGK